MSHTPTFRTLGSDLPAASSLIVGGLLSLSILASFPTLMGGSRHVPVTAGWVSPRIDKHSTVQTNFAGQNSTNAAPPANCLSLGRSQSQSNSEFEGDNLVAEDHEVSAMPLDGQQRPKATGLDSLSRHQIIVLASEELKLYYFDHELAEKMSVALLTHEKNGDDNYATDPESFAHLLTKQLRDISDDRHLAVIYSRVPLRAVANQPQTELPPSYIEEMRRTNCGFEKIEILQSNIGYLKLNSFPDISVCKEAASRAMIRVSHVDALIIDLRNNRGGFPNMVLFLAAYLFDHPEYFYNPRQNKAEHLWTQSPVAGSHLADKPVYVLTSGSTISGAEQFTYNLKMLRRATIVGETTAGAAHAGTFHRLNEHFGIAIRHVKALNPYSKYGWEETGVEPDVRISATEALDETLRRIRRAQERAARNMGSSPPSPRRLR